MNLRTFELIDENSMQKVKLKYVIILAAKARKDWTN